MFKSSERKILNKISEKFEKQVEEDSYSFFEGIVMRITYKGFETRIRRDDEYGLYWGRLDNHDKNIIFGDKDIKNVAIKFIDKVEKEKA